MVTLIRNGGFPMVFILLFGFVGLAAAGWYAFRPNARSLGFITWIAIATLFSTLMGTAADLGATLFHVARMADTSTSPSWRADLAEGLAESMSPSIVGFAFIAMTALITAMGKARATP